MDSSQGVFVGSVNLFPRPHFGSGRQTSRGSRGTRGRRPIFPNGWLRKRPTSRPRAGRLVPGSNAPDGSVRGPDGSERGPRVARGGAARVKVNAPDGSVRGPDGSERGPRVALRRGGSCQVQSPGWLRKRPTVALGGGRAHLPRVAP